MRATWRRATSSGSSRSPSPESTAAMPHGIEIALIDRVKSMVHDLVTAYARTLPDLQYADVRVGVSEAKYATAENGAPRASGDDYGFAFGIRVIAGHRMVAPGYVGRGLGASDLPHLDRLLREGLLTAYRRAMANAEAKMQVRAKFPGLGDALAETRLHPVPIRQEVVPAIFDIDPRAVPLDDMVRLTGDISARIAAIDSRLRYNYVSTTTQICRELFASSQGALIDQSFALTQGLGDVVADGSDNGQEIYDVLGHQRG